jgi:hypothetical protein
VVALRRAVALTLLLQTAVPAVRVRARNSATRSHVLTLMARGVHGAHAVRHAALASKHEHAMSRRRRARVLPVLEIAGSHAMLVDAR